MLDINVDEAAESLYNALMKIEIAQARKREKDASDFTSDAISRCRNLRHSLYK